MQISMLGIDLGKNSCSLVGLDATGKVAIRRRMRRETVINFCSKLPACTIAMEACCGAHHMGRALAVQGPTVRLMSPEYVRPYVKAQKNGDRDADAIAEAATRPTMRFVELESEEQLDMQALHRVRDRLICERTSVMKQIRSLLLERGDPAPQGKAKLAARLGELLDDENSPLTPRIHLALARSDARMCRLLSIPGIGALNATAFVAAIGVASTFARGRDLAAWLGLVPRQVTTGGKPRLLGITKRGNKYLRKMLIQGARAALPLQCRSASRIGEWLRGLLSRAHANTVVVA
jgi:transposase